MKRLELGLEAHAYVLCLDDQELARMAGGTSTLLAGAGERVRAADVEAAIERAEDWLMPSSKSWQGLDLRVRDAAGRLRSRLGAVAAVTPQEVELSFSRAVDDVLLGRPGAGEMIADLVLLRELVHHGAVPRVIVR